MNINHSNTTWVLVYDDTTKAIITTVPPGAQTTTMATLVEFNTEQEMNNFISTEGLAEPMPQ